MADNSIAAPDPGQAVPAPAAPVGQATEPFFKSGDEVFNTREDLEKAWKDNYLRRDDYTRKSQANALFRKQLEQRDKEIAEKLKTFETKQKDYETYDKFLQGRPDVFRQLQGMLRQPPSPEVAYQKAESLVNEKYGEIEKKLEEFENWKREQELEQEKAVLYNRLTQELPDFDSTLVDDRLTKLADEGLEALLRTVYHSLKGEQSPLKVEQNVVNKLKAKGEAKTASPKGEPASGKPQFKSIEEARNAALKDAQGG